MSLSAKLATQFEHGVRLRGRDYFKYRAVNILNGSATSVHAHVRGTSIYSVKVDLKDDTFSVSCDCPYFGEHSEPCKHIWATVLEAERAKLLSESFGKSDIAVVPNLENVDLDSPAIYIGRKRIPIVSSNPRTPTLTWKHRIAGLRESMQPSEKDNDPQFGGWRAGREIAYLIDAPASLNGNVALQIGRRDLKQDGTWGAVQFHGVRYEHLSGVPDPTDAHITALLTGGKRQQSDYSQSYNGYSSQPQCRFTLGKTLQKALLPMICSSGRCYLRSSQQNPAGAPLQWDGDVPWDFVAEINKSEDGSHYALTGVLRRGDQILPLADVVLISHTAIFTKERAALLNHSDAFEWLEFLHDSGRVLVPHDQVSELIEQILAFPNLPRLALPEELRYEEVIQKPTPYIRLKPESEGMPRLAASVAFDYGGTLIPANDARRGIYTQSGRRFLIRDKKAESAALEELPAAGFFAPAKDAFDTEDRSWDFLLLARNLPTAAAKLLASGWHVEAEGKKFRTAGESRIRIASGIDWFELHGGVDFGGTEASFPALLAALQRGEGTIRLDDGTLGILPEDWLKKYGLLTGLGTATDGHLRFAKSQTGLLDVLLAAQPEVECDETFNKLREELRSFKRVAAADPPATFVGELRGYQREGLGWFDFLRRFGFGGCLADDMGLGKTVQILALLDSRRPAAKRKASTKNKDNKTEVHPPSLVVVPKSLIFNWKQESARFTPKLRILDHSGTVRLKGTEHFADYDVVLTTYGTLRNDAIHFKDFEFDYLILDEAQAVKNSATESAKAVRLLRGRHRLALSGTPIENHLGELWSLFEFINPGILGRASVFQSATSSSNRMVDEDVCGVVARGLKPFILRRTKDQVAKDLPKKVEQTIFCEMEPAQKKMYVELREHYRQSLLSRIDTDGLNRSKIHVLEALLRLRQAACHPGLIDKTKTAAPSAKLDVLLPQLNEVIAEGHKALVFSQFTSFLSIVRRRLDDENIDYEYLDGKTTDRAIHVERFQTDPGCKLFLISLKAGGLGLNLTAAEYVFLLDPWWNPAVEAQAIDRAHRIGQTRQVFAYRLIARDTVEEKVLALQDTKRKLADAIINAENSVIRGLTREDLELLLS